MRKRVTLVGLLQAAAALTVLLSVVTVFDSIHHNIELFAHFRLQYLVVSVLLGTTFAVLRSHLYAVALLLAAVLNATYVLPWYVAEAPQASGAPFKILLANIHSSNEDYERLLEFVAEESPDMVFLQEVTDAWMDATSALGSGYPYHYAEPKAGNFGIAMFSRVPLDTVTHVDSPPLGYPTIVAETTLAGRELTIISTHPTIPLGREGYEMRNEHLEHVADLASRPQQSIILIGDLNVTMWSHSYRSLLASTDLRDARRGFGVIPTWPIFMPFAMIPIDHALVSRDVTVLDIRTGRSIGSDHLPLILTVAL